MKIVQRLTRFDHQAYLVGGCVRDLLLDRRPKDFDVGTSATPRQVRRLFRNCRIIGRRFRLAHIYFQNGKIIEVATFRGRNGSADPQGEDSGVLIREDNQFGTAEEDALRRDFTINSLFYDINRETVLDHADGLGDLRRRLVRTIGDPEIRFREDPIRILRAIKFAARLDFTIERETLKELRRTRQEIPKAAAPRVLEEINRFCRGGAARRSFELLRETQVFPVILSELDTAFGEQSWKLLFALLEEIDRRHVAGDEVGNSEILTVLVLPALVERLGWKWDGVASQPTGLDIRDVVDSILRPIALRLRHPRRDQELCRLTVMTLFRMVPVQRLRRHSKRAIQRRECLPQALRLLDVLADRLGGDFEEARAFWGRTASNAKADRPKEAPQQGGSRRRGRRRSGRGQADPAGERTPPRTVAARTGEDDDFFSKLPTAPRVAGDDADGDRYGAGALSAGAEGGSEAATDPGEIRPAGRRKRRSRRKRGSGSSAPDEKAAAGAAAASGASNAAASGEDSRRPRGRRRSRRRRRPASGENPASASPGDDSK